MSAPPYILVLFDSQHGNTAELASQIALGVEQSGLEARIRTVPKVTSVTRPKAADIPDEGVLYCALRDLAECSGLIVGSPTHFGNMSANMKYFWDQTVPVWLSGELQSKPAALFTSTGSMHGGQESTLLSMMLPLLHHGMLIVGIPYSQPELSQTKTGGTPYGASRVTGTEHDVAISTDEQHLAQQLGKRVAEIAKKLITH